MTGFFALGAVAALFAAIFLGKMISVPLAVAAESDARRNAAEDALGARVAVLEALQAEQRDPDAIYQYGMIVAKVMHPTLVRQQGIIHFAALVDAQHLNLDGEFEYREFVLQKLHSQGENIAFMGNLQNRTIPEVTARIIRSRC